MPVFVGDAGLLPVRDSVGVAVGGWDFEAEAVAAGDSDEVAVTDTKDVDVADVVACAVLVAVLDRAAVTDGALDLVTAGVRAAVCDIDGDDDTELD